MKNIFRSHRRRNPPQHNEEQQRATHFFNKTNDSSDGPFFSKSNGVVQTKLRVGQPGDVYEQEADAVANAVVQNQQKGTAPAIQQKGISSIQRTLTSAGTGAGTAEERMKEDQLVQEKQEPGIQKMDKPLEEDEAVKPPALQKKDMPKEEEDPLTKGAVQKKDMPKEEEDPLAKGAVQKKGMPKEEEDPLAKGAVQKKGMPKEEEEKPGAAPAVMTKSDGTQTASPQLSKGIESSKGKGSALPDTTRADMEASFGHDFSGVNIHTGQEATDLNKGLNAQAFTHGQDVYFNAGKYSPETTEGKRLLAHELTHVVQQGEKEKPIAVQRVCDPEIASCLPDEPMQTSSQDPRSWWESTGDAIAGTGAVFEYEALLRTLYQRVDDAIYAEAQLMLSKGMQVIDVANWSVEARNAAKVRIRQFDMDVVRLLAEQRNAGTYGNPIGPTYEQLRNGDPARQIRPRSDIEIIEGTRNTNARANRWAGKLRIAGRIMIAIDIGIAVYNIASAPEVDRPKVLFEETGGVVGALAGGWAGAKLGGMAGAGIGAWFGGVGAAPGALIGGIVGGVGGAIGGAWGGRKLGSLVANELYPPQQTQFEGDFE